MWRKCNEGGGARTRDLGIKSRGTYPAAARQATATGGNDGSNPHPSASVGRHTANKSQRKSQTPSYKEYGWAWSPRAGDVAFLRTSGATTRRGVA